MIWPNYSSLIDCSYLFQTSQILQIALRSSVLVDRRCFAATASDPIQKLFLDKIQEYKKKAASSADGLADSDAKMEAALQDELNRVYNNYGIPKKDQDIVTKPRTENVNYDDPKVFTEKPYETSIF